MRFRGMMRGLWMMVVCEEAREEPRQEQTRGWACKVPRLAPRRRRW